MKSFTRPLSFVIALVVGVVTPAFAVQKAYDIVIYGGTSAGVVAAVQGARAGKSVVLIEPGNHVGGMTSGGLGETDIGNVSTVGGIAREFFERVYRHYASDEPWRHQARQQFLDLRKGGYSDTLQIQWVFEPRVAEQIFRQMLIEAKVELVLNERLDLADGVKRDGLSIQSIRMESGSVFAGKAFIDCSYEGDLMAKAGVRYIVGREANTVYGETLNGIRATATKPFTVSPYRIPKDPTSGLLPGIDVTTPGPEGAGDGRTQAYNFRLCLTNVKDNQLPITKPDSYDALNYELVARVIAQKPSIRPGKSLFKLSAMPNGKTDSNNQGPFSTDVVGASYDWAEADYATRQKIWQRHKDYLQGFLWFLANDLRLPAELRTEISAWGLPKDEFTDTGGWPFQLYVREARRMVGEYVVTEYDAMGRQIPPDPVAFASYILDSHWVARYVDDQGQLRADGVYYTKMPAPMPISYRALVPRREECTNLLVPVCLSASHVAYGTIRMEPVYMMLAQAAGLSASLAIDSDKPVQDVSYDVLAAQLRMDKQVIELPSK